MEVTVSRDMHTGYYLQILQLEADLACQRHILFWAQVEIAGLWMCLHYAVESEHGYIPEDALAREWVDGWEPFRAEQPSWR